MERIDFEFWNGKEVARLLALVEAERRYYQELVAALPVAVAVLSPDRSVASANRAFRRMFGLSVEDLRRKSIDQILPGHLLIEKIRDLNVNGLPQPGFLFETEGKTFRISLQPLRQPDDDLAMETVLTVVDVSDLRAGPSLAPAVPEQPSRVPFPVESLPAVVWLADAATLRFTEVSGAVKNLLGYAPAQWLESPGFFAERIHPEDRAATLAHYRAAIEQSGEASAEFRAVTAAGEIIWCRETVRVSAPGVVSGVCAAIAQRKQIERQRLAAERRAALQGLSARLAHDLNNPLMIVTGYAEEMLHGLAPEDARRAELEEILTAARRLEGITSQLLEFTRPHAEAAHSVDLAAVLSGLSEPIARAAGESVTVDLHPFGPLWVAANRKQLEEIVLALVSATRESGGTRVTVACDTATITELAETESAAPFEPGAYARLTVAGNGHAMDAGKTLTVFESFLTKDPASESAALARAYALVREWGGDIACESDDSHGSRFTMYLPAAEPGPVTVARPPVVIVDESLAPPPPSRAEPKRETVLVVDDEPGIRTLVAKILRRERYIVLEAGSAEEAMTVTLLHGAPIDVLLTDVMLPDRSGRQVAEQLRELAPGIKILYISGFTDDESVRTGQFPPGSRFLQKPFTLGTLVGAVRAVLESA